MGAIFNWVAFGIFFRYSIFLSPSSLLDSKKTFQSIPISNQRNVDLEKHFKCDQINKWEFCCCCWLSKSFFFYFSIFTSTSRRFLFENFQTPFFYNRYIHITMDRIIQWWRRNERERKAIESKTHKVRWFITSQQALTLNASSDQNLENDLMQKMSSGNFMTPHIYSTIFFSFIDCC